MPRSRGRKGLLEAMALIPLIVVGAVTTGSAGVEEGMNGGTSGLTSAGEGRSYGRRRLQTTYSFATQLEMTVCLAEGHTSDAATVDSDQFKKAVMTTLNLTEEDYVKTDDALTDCAQDDWQMRVSVYNEEDDSGQTAADIASAQVDTIYISPGTTQFFEELSTAINNLDADLLTEKEDFDLDSLGFLVIWLDEDGDVVNTQGTSESKDVVNIGGTDVWWPWWAWLIYTGVVLCCICPMLLCFFRRQWQKEAEREGFPTSGKELGTPALPSATSTNPHGGIYPTSAEDSKNEQ